jgi:hypothetical protein
MKTQSNHHATGRFSRLLLAAFLLVGLALNVGLPYGLSTTPANAANKAQVGVTVSPGDTEGTLHGVVIGNGVSGQGPASQPGGGSPTETPPAGGLRPTYTPAPPPTPTALVNPAKVEICHFEGSGSYSDQLLSISGVLSGHAGHASDIIPAFSYDGGSFPGLNWDAAGIATWTNGCTTPPQPTANALQPALPSTTNCAYTTVYWKNHLSSWPVMALTIGGLSYTQAQIVNLLQKPANGDISLAVFQQVVAVMLSAAHGANASVVQPTINGADDWLWDNPPNSKPTGAAGDKGAIYAATLTNFSSGIVGPGHCPDDTSVSPALQPVLQPGKGKPIMATRAVGPQTNATARPGSVSGPQTNTKPTDPPLPTPVPESKKVELCHASASYTNPYQDINVSINSVENAISVHGHGDHTGPIFVENGPKDWGDIIPPFDYGSIHFPGLNWDATGQSVWANGCDGTILIHHATTPTAPANTTPTATWTPQPTATNTPMPTATQAPSASYDVKCQKGNVIDSNGVACSEPYYGSHYLYSKANGWWKTGDYCMAASECASVPPATPPPSMHESPTDVPCTPRVLPSGFVLDCTSSDNNPGTRIDTGNVYAALDTSCPINQVLRSPYPRSMVNVTTTFNLLPQDASAMNGVRTPLLSPANVNAFVDAQGNPTEAGYKAGIWRNLVLTMRSYRLDAGVNWLGQNVPPPQWNVTDRSWNDQAPYKPQQDGSNATYVFQTSSFGLATTNGRAFDMVNKVPANTYNLPAYGVSIVSFCGHEWMVTYQIAGRSWQQDGACYQTALYPDGTTLTPDGTSNLGCDPGWVATGHWSYEWVNKTMPWAGVDMRGVGKPNTYDTRLRSQSGGMFKGQQYWDATTGVWVPVIEVQTVLDCSETGSCTSPQP